MANVTLKRWDGTQWVELLPTPRAHTHAIVDITNINTLNGLVRYIVGNTTGTAGTWTGTDSNITSYYDGLTIAFKIGIAGNETTTLNINSLGARVVKRNTENLTTELPINTVLILVYTTISGTGFWVFSDVDTGPEVVRLI
jgi:hypothetical protein